MSDKWEWVVAVISGMGECAFKVPEGEMESEEQVAKSAFFSKPQYANTPGQAKPKVIWTKCTAALLCGEQADLFLNKSHIITWGVPSDESREALDNLWDPKRVVPVGGNGRLKLV